jgi:Mrp family chromosome partitioning ATPase
VASQIYQQLLQKREEARLNMAIAPTSARVIEPPEVPTRPVAPLKGPTAPVLLLAGLAAAFAAGSLKDVLDRSARPQDLTGYLQALKIYAAVPTLAWHERRHGELLVGTSACPHYVESLKTLALALEEQCGGPRGAVIGLSSTAAREGKSVTLANLALALAEAGHEVLLVDADMRRPRVGSLFGLVGGRGLTEVLTDKAKAMDVVRRAGTIDVVTAGEVRLESGLAKLRTRLAPALEVWRQQYDFVLLDLPPLVVLAEVVQVARQTDGVLMLANLHQVPAEALVAGVQQLQALSAPVVGLVAISQMIGQSKGGYYLIPGEGLIS